MSAIMPIIIALTLATGINAIVTAISWHRRRSTLGSYFAYAMLGITLWTFAALLGYVVAPLSHKIFFATLEAWGYLTALPLLSIATMLFAGNQAWAGKRWVKALFILAPASAILLVSSNSLHGWVWSGFVMSDQNILIFQHGPAFTYILIIGYAMIAIMLLHLGMMLRKNSSIARRQSLPILAATIIPIGANLAYHFSFGGIQGVDWTSVTFSGSAIFYLWALTKTSLFDLTPIARTRLFDNLRDGMIALDRRNRIIDINHVAAHMLSAAPETLAGKPLAEMIPHATSLLNTPIDIETSGELVLENGVKRYFDLLVSPIYDDHAAILGRMLIFRDITSRKENELRLRQLTQAVEQSPISVIITDLDGNIMYANPRFTELTGYSLEEVRGQNARVIQSGQTSIHTYRDMWQTILSGQVWRGEFLNRKKNGELYWEEAVIGPVIDNNDTILNFIATKEDITKRKEAETALRISEEKFRQYITAAPDAVLIVDSNGCITFANQQSEALLGYPPDDLIGQNVELLLPIGMREKHMAFREPFRHRPEHRKMGRRGHLRARHRDGHDIPVDINLSYVITENGPLFIANIRDVTEQVQAEHDLRTANALLTEQLEEIRTLQAILKEQAIRDPLTQLYNRRFLNETIQQEFLRAQRTGHAVSIVLLDIDHFKRINDTYGHHTGDACLVELANLLRSVGRRTDIACRYGGEEFLIVLPDTPAAGASHYAAYLREQTELIVFTYNDHHIRFTISIGVATFPADGSTYIDIINHADEALYHSKKRGRNRVTMWEEARTTSLPKQEYP